MQQSTSKWIVRFWSEDGKRCWVQQWDDEHILQSHVARMIANGTKFQVEALPR